MLAPNENKLHADMQVLLHDAHVLLHTAAALTGEKANEVRQRARELIEATALKAQRMQACAIGAGKEAAASTDAYVHTHPWRAMAVAAGAGLVVGLILRRVYCCDDS